MSFETKLDKYCKKYINSNYDHRDKNKEDYLLFEWFVNSMHSWFHASQSYNLKSQIGKEISLGSSHGLDSFFVKINNHIYSLNDAIYLETNICDLVKSDNIITFHFLQIKGTSKTDLGDFKKFAEVPLKILKGLDIFDNNPKLLKVKSLIKSIISNDKLLSARHKFEMYYYTKKNQNDIEKLNKDWKKDIEYYKNEYSEFLEIDFKIEGLKFLNETYERFISNDIKLYVEKNNLQVVKENEYLIGYLTAKELLDCIAPSSESSRERILQPDVFKNNIRLYLGTTNVNVNIENTLKNEPTKFHLYNNGITITTKDINYSHARVYEISPVNIVNGCQTANSIYNVFKLTSKKEEEVKIPVKIIKADDDEYEKITIRTNSQNGLSEKDLVSITSIQKDLEDRFNNNKIQGFQFFYKRQNSELRYDSENIDFIVNINDILRASFSTILLIPHKVSGYFDSTTVKYIDTIFEEEFLDLYYLMSVQLKLINEQLELNYPDLLRLKYHLSYLLYKFCNKNIDVNMIEKYFNKKKSNESNFNLFKHDKVLLDMKSNIVLNIKNVLENKMYFQKCIDYLIKVVKEQYPELININSRLDEKVLYKTVDKSQNGRKLFKDFDSKFSKDINEIINR